MTLTGYVVESFDNTSPQKTCWHCGQALGAEHRGYCLAELKFAQACIGTVLRPRFDLTDYHGEHFDMAENGKVVLRTRSTLHVCDPHGHVHKRYAKDFTTQPRGFIVEEKHCAEWQR